MKLISWNINGLRAAAGNGFRQWFEDEDADILCLQEIKARPEQLPCELQRPPGYHAYFHAAEKPGYSGLAVYCRQKPVAEGCGMNLSDIDREARVMWLQFPDFTLVNAYFPHARRDLSRLDFKLYFCREFLGWLRGLEENRPPVILCGDYNISHQAIDLANPVANRKNAGFLPEERAWMDRFLASGYRDVFRDRHPGEAGHYTWWSNRKGVRERNVGWRIDYHCVADALVEKVRNVGHQPQVPGSDHCPIFLTLAC